jgi:hypothetical protein
VCESTEIIIFFSELTLRKKIKLQQLHKQLSLQTTSQKDIMSQSRSRNSSPRKLKVSDVKKLHKTGTTWIFCKGNSQNSSDDPTTICEKWLVLDGKYHKAKSMFFKQCNRETIEKDAIKLNEHNVQGVLSQMFVPIYDDEEDEEEKNQNQEPYVPFTLPTKSASNVVSGQNDAVGPASGQNDGNQNAELAQLNEDLASSSISSNRKTKSITSKQS